VADLNPNKRASLARCSAGVMAYEFTSDFVIGGNTLSACISELDDSDKLEIAGRDDIRAMSVTVLAQTTTSNTAQTTITGLDSTVYTEGDSVTLDGDANWQIKRWKVSPDGALVTFLLLDGQ
jgi:hypothetical protein